MINNKYPTTKPSLNLDFANTKSLDPRINFRRGTPGTYYDGKTYAKAEENLISYSEDFANAYWRVNQITITTGHSSPDGGSTARKLAPTSGTGNKFIEVESGGNENDFPDLASLHFAASVFAKAGEKKYLKFATVDTNLTRRNDVIVDLSDGSIIESINNDETQYSVEPAGGDWYRIGITGFGMQQLQVFVLGDDLSANAAGDGTSGIYLWGAQLEQRDSVTAYTPTNGNPITKYQPQLMFASPDQPRFDHDVLTGESKGLLIEESRTNLIRWSEDFAIEPEMNYYYCTIDDNRIVAPDGNLSADAIIFDDGTNAGLSAGHREVVSSGEKYTASIYAKAGNLSKVWFYFNVRETNEAVNVGNSGIKYNLLTNTVDEIVDTNDQFSTEYNIFDVGNGWYRLVISATMPSNAGFLGWALYNYEDNVSSGKNTAYIWGAQLEEGSFATSYIKTSGASATRSADNASITGENFSSWYRQDEGSLYSEVNTLASSSYSRISMSDGTSSNRIFISNGIYPLYINKNGDIQVRESSGAIVNVYSKRAAGLKKNDFALSIDGGDPLVDTSGDLPLVDRLAFSTSHASDNYVNGHIKKLSYYPQRLTNEQLQQLTK